MQPAVVHTVAPALPFPRTKRGPFCRIARAVEFLDGSPLPCLPSPNHSETE